VYFDKLIALHLTVHLVDRSFLSSKRRRCSETLSIPASQAPSRRTRRYSLRLWKIQRRTKAGAERYWWCATFSRIQAKPTDWILDNFSFSGTSPSASAKDPRVAVVDLVPRWSRSRMLHILRRCTSASQVSPGAVRRLLENAMRGLAVEGDNHAHVAQERRFYCWVRLPVLWTRLRRRTFSRCSRLLSRIARRCLLITSFL
jgi:hypothetical protein